jgi:multiple sugar transport system permease protein
MAKTNFVLSFIKHFILILCGLSMALPLLWMLSTALKSSDKIFSYPPEWIPTRSIYQAKDGSEHPVTIFHRSPGRIRVQLTADLKAAPVWQGHQLPERLVEKKGSVFEVPQSRILDDNCAYLHRKLDISVNDKNKLWAVFALKAPVKILKRLSQSEYDIRFADGSIKKSVPAENIREKIFFNWSNFLNVWKVVPFGRYYLNSFFVAICVTLGQLLTCSMAAFAFARLRFPFRDKIFFLYLMTLMIPAQVTMIPLFILMTEMNMVDTYSALIFPPMFSAYGTFMLRQFFLTLPRELEEAACIDGCGLWKIFCVVILPLSKPALATLGIFTFMGNWNSFIWPLIITNSETLKTLPVGLASFNGQYSTDWSLLMAACVMMIAPLIAVFIFGQRFFVKGIQMGAIKG